MYEGIEFVKHFRAHIGAIAAMCISSNGATLASCGEDKAIKIFDVRNFDMSFMLKLEYKPLACVFVHKEGSYNQMLGISGPHGVQIVNVDSGKPMPVRTYTTHPNPPHLIRYIPQFHCVLSTDPKGSLEIWDPDTLKTPECVDFTMKSDTSLYELLKEKTSAISLAVSKDGLLFAMMCADGRLRIFRTITAKLMRIFDESIELFSDAQSDPQMTNLHLDRFDFGRRLAVEKELRKSPYWDLQTLDFDDTSSYLVYPSPIGIKVVSLVSNEVARVLGKVEHTERFLGVYLFQGKAQKKKLDLGESVVNDKEMTTLKTDPTIFCTAYKKHRFFLFSNREPSDIADQGRDIFNEKPTKEDQNMAASLHTEVALGKQAIIHTTMGDIVVKLFPAECPKTVENFTVHSRNGYYDGIICHRVIQGFMIQTGDPNGDGTGGESIWGGEFEDEFHRSLKHDRPFTLSMANAGPNTNGSQFFITTVPCSWLDNKHTVFGRVTQGMDVVQQIEKVKTTADDRPLQDIKILAIKII
eukprot:GEMP01040579.1.p1 GENE.GEMP01040579.1~~GEMP01040579.1.p1  ORF type:complete len:614 (+),score=127.20 GEMP01040579.1:270-1844(+)